MRTLALLLTLFGSAAYGATITPIVPGPGEPSLFETLDSIYGAGNYTRVDDDSDQIWHGGTISVRALSTYSGASQHLGLCVVCDGSDDVYFDQVFTADGVFSTSLTSGGLSSVFVSSSFTWFDHAGLMSIVGKVYSDSAKNALSADQMVTFAVAGQPRTYVLAFEDWLFNMGSDGDYQDFLIEVIIVNPEPSAILSLAGGLAALFYLRRRKNANRNAA